MPTSTYPYKRNLQDCKMGVFVIKSVKKISHFQIYCNKSWW